jgi:beta-glucanase (GH16 family)
MRFIETYIARLLLVLTAPSAIHAHSWVEKVESIYGEGVSRIGMDTLSDTSRTRYFCPLPSLIDCQPAAKHGIVLDSSAMRPCRSDLVSDPKATTRAGTDLRIKWNGSGHVGNGQSDGTCVKVMIAKFEADPDFEDFVDIPGAECLDFDGQDRPEGTIAIPGNLAPGGYTLLWYWNFTEFVYSSCIDIDVSDSGTMIPTASPTKKALEDAVIQDYLRNGCSELQDSTEFCRSYTTIPNSYCLDNEKDECGRSTCHGVANFLFPCPTCPPGCPKPEKFFDDFNNGLDKSKWLVAHKSWGGGNGFTNGGVVLENVEEDSTNGKVIFHAHGNDYNGDIKGINKDLSRQSTGVRTGSAIATRAYFGAGSYEIRMKAAEELGVCSAIWTFYYNDDDYYSGVPIVNHEIDIELPGRPGPGTVGIDFDQALLNTWVGEIDSLYEAGYTQLPSRQDDGQFHTWRFDWHTEEADRKVEFYLDGQLLRTMRNHIPFYAGRLWLGAWFPNAWAGEGNFAHAQMEVDWVRFTPFDEPYECPDESYPDFGWAPDTSFAEPTTTEKCTYVTSAPNPAPPVNDDVIVDDDDTLLLVYYDDGCKDLPSTFCGNQMTGSYCKDYQSDSCDRSICQFDTFTMLNACPSPGSPPTGSPTASSTGSPTDGEDDESVYLTKGCTALPEAFCSGYNGGYCKHWQSDGCGRSICKGDGFSSLEAC